MNESTGHQACEAALATARAETRSAFENRGLIYLHLYRELVKEIGADRAAEVMKRAIRDRGVEVGRKYRAAAEAGDLSTVADLFCTTSPCEGALFEPGVEERTESRLVLRMTGCPLVDSWRDSGASAEEIDVMCDIAAAVDFGTFEGAGLSLRFLERAGQPGCDRCLLEITLP